MEIYTLDSSFRRQEIVDQRDSVIWTERFKTAGDVTLTVPPTPTMASLLQEGTLLGLEGSKEVMLLETALVEDGLLKVTGNTLSKFLDNRIFMLAGLYDPKYLAYTGKTPSQVIADMVSRTCISSDTRRGTAGSGMVDGAYQSITGLELGDIDASGATVDMQVEYGPLYTRIENIANTYDVGFSLYLDSVSEDGYVLKFTTYLGRDLTSDQSTYPVVQFSPNLDSLANLKELRSIANYKNVAIAYAPDYPEGYPVSPAIAYAPDGAASREFDRRTIVIQADDATVDKLGSLSAVEQVIAQMANDALANNNYTKVVDGEIVSQAYKFGVDYTLGDIVELDSLTGLSSSARITEHIRTEDETGEREYPTVAVI